MKWLFLFSILTTNLAIANTSYDCEITSVKFNMPAGFELGVSGGTYTLGDELSSNISLDRSTLFETLYIGDSSFESTDFKLTEGDKLLRVRLRRENDIIRFTLNKSSKTGLLSMPV